MIAEFVRSSRTTGQLLDVAAKRDYRIHKHVRFPRVCGGGGSMAGEVFTRFRHPPRSF